MKNEVLLALYYKEKEVDYEGYERQKLSADFFKRAYRGVHSSKVDISFPEVKSKKGELLVDEVKIVHMDWANNEYILYSVKFDKNIRLSEGMTPLFKKNKLKIERLCLK